MPILSFLALIAAVLTLTTADGHATYQAATATRQIEIEMHDHAFSPNSIEVVTGETVTFVFTNVGHEVHDAFIGDKAAQEQHEREMRAGSGGHDHAHHGGVTVRPGHSGSLSYSFDKPGALEIACHQPGHYQAGMVAIVNVKPAERQTVRPAAHVRHFAADRSANIGTSQDRHGISRTFRRSGPDR